MRLLQLQDDGEFSLIEFIGNYIPKYAILSHTWGSENDEYTFQDLANGTGKNKAGYCKVRFCGKQAKKDALKFFWVDTCCIDKSSSAELSEAINSMFYWYQNAQKCYVYLPDVSNANDDTFRKCRWFTRGWTLQELIAPKLVEFFCKDEELLGDKQSLEQIIHDITKIPVKALRGDPLSNFSMAERFSWAAKRQTTREEDEVYCLLGIFGVYLPLIYGERRLHAMKRLLNEVEEPVTKLSKTIKEDTNVVRTQIPVIQSGLNQVRQDQGHAKHRRLIEWISPTDHPTQQSDIIKRKQPGTGQWFLNAHEVVRWLSEPRGTLFCPGIPGAGKTIAAAIVIDHLLKLVQSSSHGVAYVYCNYKAQNEQDVSSMLAAILKQLVQGRPSAMEPVERLHQQHAYKGTMPSLGEIFSTLQDVLGHYCATYIVIDALDECRNSDGTRNQFLAKLRDLQTGRDIRLLVTSRFIPDVVNKFKEAPRLEVLASKEDVKCFVAGQIYRLPRCVQRDSALQEIVQNKIVEAADGMFLLARLHTDSLLDKRTVKDVKLTLAGLSKGSAALNDAYKEAIHRIESQLSGDYKLAKKILSWVTCARRPLTTAELCCALAVEPRGTELDLENVLEAEDLVSVCAGLVVIDQESAIIRLVHYTAQEYFEHIMEQWNPSAQLDITSICLTYLSFDAFKSGSCSTNEKYKKRLRRSNLLEYAAKYWGEHATTVQTIVSRLASIFLWDSNLVSSAVQAMTRADMLGNYFATKMTGLHLTAIFGLLSLSEMLVSQFDENVSVIDSRNSQSRTPLSFAAEKGHDAVVKLLLSSKRVDPNLKDCNGWTPLLHAADNGHEAVVKTLLASDALDPNWGATKSRETLLLLAAKNGHEAVVKLVLASDKVDINSNPFGGRVPLLWAAKKGHETIVKLLLENENVNPDSKDEFGETVLVWAAKNGEEAIVKRLLVSDRVNPNSMTEFGWTSLLWAVVNEHEAVVKLLLISDRVDPNLKDDQGQTPLIWAARNGHEAIAKQLLAIDKTEPDPEDNYRQTPLLEAARYGHIAIVNLLLAREVNPNSKDSIYEFTPFLWAVYNGHEAVVKLLLVNNKIEPNLKDRGGHTPLYWAENRGHEAVVKLLLASNRVDPA